MQKVKIPLLITLIFLIAFFAVFRTQSDPYRSEIKKCTSLQLKNECWTELIKKALKEKGLKEALLTVRKVYDIDPGFSSACHDIGHYLGKEAFLLFKNGDEFEITKEAAFCSYGFYHGFMESMIASGEDTEKVRDFCDYIDTQISKESPDAALQCFHGIGHGWVNVHDEKGLWGKDEAIADRGLALCEQVSKTDSDLSRCATGVFNGISFFYINGEYNLVIKKNDPLWLCARQPDKYKSPCYLSMNSFIMSFSGGDFIKAAGFMDHIKEPDVASQAILNLAITLGIKNMENPNPAADI